MYDILEKIKNGVYSSKLPYPTGSSQNDREARKKYKEDTYNLEKTLFRNDLKKEFGTSNWNKEEVTWDRAWEEGHSEGLYKVYECYMDLVSDYFN
jgi:hypothetical protein